MNFFLQRSGITLVARRADYADIIRATHNLHAGQGAEVSDEGFRVMGVVAMDVSSMRNARLLYALNWRATSATVAQSK